MESNKQNLLKQQEQISLNPSIDEELFSQLIQDIGSTPKAGTSIVFHDDSQDKIGSNRLSAVLNK